MTPTLEAAEAGLVGARRRGEPDALAEALAVHANALVERGQVGPARLELDEAAAIHRRRGRVYDEARLTHLAATLCRLEGKLDEARARAERAAQLAEPGTPVAVSAATELGEIALAEGKGAEAAAAYARALAHGATAGLVGPARAALLRKRATALAMAGRHAEAAGDLAQAHELLVQAGDGPGAVRTLVETATVLHQGADAEAADRALREALREAEAAGDHHALADLNLLVSARAVERRDVPAAMTAAQTARSHALSAVAPVSYIAAAIAIAELADAAGDRPAAYEALAVGWVTLGDLLGREAAKSTFEPKLLALRQKWGPAAFAEVKAAYEARRRAELAVGTG